MLSPVNAASERTGATVDQARLFFGLLKMKEHFRLHSLFWLC